MRTRLGINHQMRSRVIRATSTLSAYDALAGGIQQSHIDNNGKVDVNGTPDYVPENLNRLMTGVEYAGGYEFMADTGFSTPTTPAEYFAAFGNNKARANGHMRILVGTATGESERKLRIYLDSVLTYVQPMTESVGVFSLQAHWGSGVVFENMKITNN